MSEMNCNPNKPFKEAVCVDVMRVFDSCSSQECLEDLQFSFSTAEQEVINTASYIKTKCIQVTGVSFAIDPVPFNNGFYTVDVTYNFRAEIEAYFENTETPTIVYGRAAFSKKVILFGSDGNTQRFVSDGMSTFRYASKTSGCAACCSSAALPTAAASIAEPMCLDAKLVPDTAAERNDVLITIGIFAIIQLERPVPIMIPAFDYCIPGKECSTNTDTPCELFDKINFPIGEFFPQGLTEHKPCCSKLEEEPAEEEPKG